MTIRPAPNRRAAIVAPVRTPVGTFGGGLRAVPVEELAATAIKAVLERTGIDPEIIDDVCFRAVLRQRRDALRRALDRPGSGSPGRGFRECNSTGAAPADCRLSQRPR